MEEQNVDQAQTQEAQPETAAPDLNISDLVAIRNIIDVASQRGAFKANELESVGKTYNKLAGFLDSVTKQKESA
jgi:hypothetical protein